MSRPRNKGDTSVALVSVRWGPGGDSAGAVWRGISVVVAFGRGESSPGREGSKAGGAQTRGIAAADRPGHQATPGGMERITDQPGTVRAFERATLYAKVSGYLKELKVDRGDLVKKNQVLAQIYVPEVEVAVLQAQSGLDHSKAMATQAEARVQGGRGRSAGGRGQTERRRVRFSWKPMRKPRVSQESARPDHPARPAQRRRAEAGR